MCNGSTGTVLGVSRHGLDLLTDDGDRVQIGADIVAGHRADGTPNVSHAWARTVDGAQGGTWCQVHLLGTPALDRFSGYVGQSRGQLPTHTWNTRPDCDHPLSLLADDRSPGQAVLDAMRRDQPKTFAAVDDPWVLDRELGAERAAHTAVIATRPADRRAELERARDHLERAAQERHWATQGLIEREDERARLGPRPRLRRGGRDNIIRHDQAVADAHDRLARAERALHDARLNATRAEAAVANRATWDRRHRWRLERVAEIDDQLSHHWADVVLRAARADDPLAFGIDHLRDAHAVYRADLHDIHDALPSDRRDALQQAEADLHHHKHRLRDAEREITRAQSALDAAHQRRWGRRDNDAIARAAAEVTTAKRNHERTAETVTHAKARIDQEHDAVRAWQTATRDTAHDRAALTNSINDLDAALAATRPERVAAAALNPTHKLWQLLGPPPATRGGLAAWCGIAERIEDLRDRGASPDGWIDHVPDACAHPMLGLRPALGRESDDLARVLSSARELVDAASRLDSSPTTTHGFVDRSKWQATLRAADDALATKQRAVDYSLGLEL